MLYFLRVTALNVPQLTRLVGIVLILAVGVIHAFEAPEDFRDAAYIGVALVINAVASLAAAVGIFFGAKNWGWLLGAYVAGGAFMAYLVTRAVGLDGFEAAVGKWANPVGTFSLVVEGLFVALYLSVATGAAVAAPEKRDWHD
jgi:hypothetical protein